LIRLRGGIETACEMMVYTLKKGNKVLLAGNGGSAADDNILRLN